MLIGIAIGEFALGFLGALTGGVIVSIFSLINASKKSNSRTKISCLSCKEKTYL
jgi:gas vesicle protein